MKKINIPFRTQFISTLDTENEKVILSMELHETMQTFRKRGQAIIQSSLDIEEWIKDIIANLLFTEKFEHVDFMKELFLDSDFCMFNSKVKILNSTLKYLNLLTGKERDKIQNILPKIIKYRNLFAHGKIYCKNDIFHISYFDGNLKEKELNDEFWMLAESILNEAHNVIANLESKISQKT